MRRRDDKSTKRRNKNIVLFFFISLVALVITVWFTIASEGAGRRLIPISILALIGGVLFEGKRISRKWSTLFGITLSALVFSMLAFLPGKGESDYQLDVHIQLWPYWFIVSFAISTIAVRQHEIIPRLTEGITLLQSIAVVYWVIDFGLLNTNSYFLATVMGIGVLFAVYSAFHAFTHAELTRNSRLILSLWSSFIMVLFAIENVYRVYQNEQIENTTEFSQGAYIGLQFFLLGVSAIYIIQNIIMLLDYLPGRNRFFNSQYFRELRMLNEDHIQRYSKHQVNIGYAVGCTLLAGVVFALNYHYQILPRHMAIWTVLVILPLFPSAFEYARARYQFGERDVT